MNKLIELLRTYTIDSKLVRYGRSSDGGYVVPVALIDDCELIYSYGAGPDISFETDVIKYKNIRCNIYDHTVDRLPIDVNNPNIIFIKEGLSFDKKEMTDNFLHHVEQNNDLKKKILLKVDIEGAEYDFFEKLDIEAIENVIGLVLELHWIKDNIERAINILSKLNRKFILTHVHGNNFGGVFLFDGYVIPDSLELTFANRELYEFKLEKKQILPIVNVDYPCNSEVLDYLIPRPDSNQDAEYYKVWVAILMSKENYFENSIKIKDEHYSALMQNYSIKMAEIAQLHMALNIEWEKREDAEAEIIRLRGFKYEAQRLT